MSAAPARILSDVPAATLEWLLEPDNPAVAVLTRRTLLGEPSDDAETAALWARRNEHPPIAGILDAQLADGAWDVPSRDYQKYGGSLWQVHFLGELWADRDDQRVRRAADYAFSRQLADGSWSVSNMQPRGSIQCLTANVARALARLGWARDERIARAIAYVVDVQRDRGPLVCAGGYGEFTLNGYCHMLAPKLLLLLGEVPRDAWPEGAEEVRGAAVEALRDKQVFRCLPNGSRDYLDLAYAARKSDLRAVRAKWLAEHSPLEYKEKPGWLKFGFPLSYNSDALEALWALTRVGETPRAEYAPATELVRKSADAQMRWALRNTLNGKMRADVEQKGAPSKWLTLRALQVLAWTEGDGGR